MQRIFKLALFGHVSVTFGDLLFQELDVLLDPILLEVGVVLLPELAQVTHQLEKGPGVDVRKLHFGRKVLIWTYFLSWFKR
jgi:hypothetical protein